METTLIIIIVVATACVYGLLGYEMSKFLPTNKVMRAINSKKLSEANQEKLPTWVYKLYDELWGAELLGLFILMPMAIYGFGGGMLFFQIQCVWHLVMYCMGMGVLYISSRVGAYIGCVISTRTLESA